jgi:hypothetical protein
MTIHEIAARDAARRQQADVVISDEGTIVTFTPLTDEARDWFDDNVHSESWQWLGRALGVDHRLASDLVAGIADAGLRVEVR